MCYDIQIRIPKTITAQGGFLYLLLHCQNRKVSMDIKDPLRAAIEFLLLEGCAGEEILTRLGTCRAQLRTVAFQYLDGSKVRCGSEKRRKEGRPGGSDQHKTDAAIPAIL
jgi:hypothetical protein